jgi:hypothetical protein
MTFSSEVVPSTSSFLMYRFPLLGDGPERLLAAAWVLPRREAEPGGEIASRLEPFGSGTLAAITDNLANAANFVEQLGQLPRELFADDNRRVVPGLSAATASFVAMKQRSV